MGSNFQHLGGAEVQGAGKVVEGGVWVSSFGGAFYCNLIVTVRPENIIKFTKLIPMTFITTYNLTN
jgi:hypothetical protein